MPSHEFWKQLRKFLDIPAEKIEEDEESQVRVYVKGLSFKNIVSQTH